MTFLVNEEDRVKRPVSDLKVIESFIRRVRRPLGNGVMPLHGLLVDSFIINWAPHQIPETGGITPAHERYAVERGYWDDWWSRKRVSPKGAPSVRADALPQRGYVEVNLNAYS